MTADYIAPISNYILTYIYTGNALSTGDRNTRIQFWEVGLSVCRWGWEVWLSRLSWAFKAALSRWKLGFKADLGFQG